MRTPPVLLLLAVFVPAAVAAQEVRAAAERSALSAGAEASACPARAAEAFPSPPLSLWPGESSTADTACENEGVGHGTLAYRAGALGMGFDLSGDDWVSVPTALGGGLAATDAFTLSAWFVADTFVAGASIVNLRDAANDSGYHLSAHGSNAGTVVFGVNTAGTTTFATASAPGFPAGAVHQVAATFNSVLHELRLYRDCALVARNAAPGGTEMVIDNDETFEIGRAVPGGAKWDGLIDEVTYFNYQLEADAVALLCDANGIFFDGFESGGAAGWDDSVL